MALHSKLGSAGDDTGDDPYQYESQNHLQQRH